MKRMFTAVALLGGIVAAQAQTLQVTDPFDTIFERAALQNPNFRNDLQAHQAVLAAKAAAYENTGEAAGRTTANRIIPVVFHVVLTPSQLTQMSGQAAVIARIKSQIEVLNQDFNAKNADSTKIPAAFKPLYANMNYSFALATRDPQGASTPGYEFVTTAKTSFDADGSGTTGSKYYCSDAKYAASGGADAWDPTRYVNVWVVNIAPTGVGGVGTPPPYPIYGGTAQLPWAEQGVALLYSALGKRISPTDYFFSSTIEKGRVLVHELGHFFNLFHPFGIATLNNANCQDDDGVLDTPPQAGPTQSTCPAFPRTDACSPATPGVMFVNYMDYEAQECALMFSKGQRARAYVETESGSGYRYDLLQHPELTATASAGVTAALQVPTVRVYPNPASGTAVADLNLPVAQRVSYTINSLTGTVVATADKGMRPAGPSTLQLDVAALPAGLYLYRICTGGQTTTGKLQLVR